MHFVSETSNRPLAGAFNCSSNTLVRALRMTFSGDTLGTQGARALGNLRRPFINPNVTGYQSLEGIGVRSSEVIKGQQTQACTDMPSVRLRCPENTHPALPDQTNRQHGVRSGARIRPMRRHWTHDPGNGDWLTAASGNGNVISQLQLPLFAAPRGFCVRCLRPTVSDTTGSATARTR
jgi:hypothetical protein